MKIIIIITNKCFQNGNVHNAEILDYSKIDVSEGIDVNKTSVSKESIICHYFLDKGFKFQPSVCNKCYDVLKITMNHKSIAILNI